MPETPTPAFTNDAPLLFALEGSDQFGGAVAAALGITLSALEERPFEDGEHKSRPLVNVRGRNVFVVHSLYGDPRQSGNDKLCRLLFFIGALKDSSARRVTAVVPYLAYARKDRKSKPRDPVTTRYVAALFEAVGTDAVVTMDVHNLAAFQNAFRCNSENLEANPLFITHFAARLAGRDPVVVAPDAGGIKRADQFRRMLAQALGVPVGAAFAEKYRSGGVVSGNLLVGEVQDRDAIIIDDLVSTGTTLARTAHACRKHGAAHVLAAVTHGLFTGDAAHVLQEPALDGIVVTDTVPPFRLGPGAVRDKLTVLRSADLFAEAIRRLHCGGSISELMAS